MADYQDIRGLRVKYLSADPSTATAGEVWYNSTTGTLNATVMSTAAWSSGGTLGTARYQCNGQTSGTKTAGLIAGGTGGAPSSNYSITEEYNGTGWAVGGALPKTSSNFGMVGTQTATVMFAGLAAPSASPAPPGSITDSTQSNEYNGASWTASPGSYPTALSTLCGAGTQTAALGMGGWNEQNTTAEYDGATWTAATVLPTGKDKASAFGSQTAAAIFGGNGGTTTTDEYNGTGWTAGGTCLAVDESGASGTLINGLGFGGQIPNTDTTTQAYDGTSWATSVSMATGRSSGSSAGIPTDGSYYAGGGNPSGTAMRAYTEEFSASVAETQTLTTS